MEEEISEIKKYFELNKNGNTTHLNVWDAVRAVLRGKFVTLNKQIRRTKINNLSFHLRKSLKEKSK